MSDDKPPSKLPQIRLNVSSKDVSRKIKKAEGATVKHARRFVFRRMDSLRDARRHIALWVLAIGIVIGAAGMQFVWYQKQYRTEAAAVGGVYAEAVQGPLESLDPLFASSSAEKSASKLLYSTLLSYDTKGSLNYDLANSMNISDDGTVYTIGLRSDARWHDGLYVRAKDVAFTVGLVKDSSTRSTLTGWTGVKVEVVDPLTVKFTLPSAYTPFADALEQLPILPEHILRDIEPGELEENAFSTEPIGSGPFEWKATQEVDAETGRKIVYLTRNNEYYGGITNLERFQLQVYEDSNAVIAALKSGEVNAATDLSILDGESVKSDKYQVDSYGVNSGVYALFNTTSPVLKDAKVRQALQAGTDTVTIRENLSEQTPELYLPFIARQVESEKLPTAPVYDTERAAALLDEAGWKLADGSRQKDGETLRLNLVTTKNDDFEQVISDLSSQWRSLGITVTTSIVDASDPTQNFGQDVLQPRQYDVLLYQLVIGGDPDVYAYWHSSQASNGLNFSNYQNDISDDALLGARQQENGELRDTKYVTFAKQWLSDAPAIGLYQATAQYAHTKGARQGDLPSSLLVSSIDRYADVTHWTVGTHAVYQTP